MRPRGVGFRIAIVLGGLGLVWFLVHPNRMVNVGPRVHRFTGNCSIALQDLHVLRAMLDSFARDHDGRCALTLESLLSTEVGGEGYLATRTTVPRDPWKHPYLLAVAAGEPWFLVGSLGRDGRLGGEGDDADLWLDSRATR
jgi:hypothetical protein